MGGKAENEEDGRTVVGGKRRDPTIVNAIKLPAICDSSHVRIKSQNPTEHITQERSKIS